MLGLLKKQKPYAQDAKTTYADILQATCQPVFCTKFNVPDTMDARFDLLVLHLSLVIDRTLATDHAGAQDFNQALFDILFIDMDQTLRNMGIGDTGLRKRIKKMMKGFNGRLQTYANATTDAELTEALARNIYAASTTEDAKKLTPYVKKQQAALAKLSFDDILTNDTLFTGH